MSRREQESLRERDYALFGSAGDGPAEPDANNFFFGEDDDAAPTMTRAERRRTVQARRRRSARRGWLFVVVVAVIVSVAAVIGARYVWSNSSSASAPDYAGTGAGTVTVTVTAGDLTHIGQQLHAAGVVKSTQAFTDAANDNSRAESIQPGRYELARHMSAKSALAQLLDPTSRVASADVLVTEGATTLDAVAALTKCYGASRTAAIRQAMRSPGNLSLPVTYQVGKRFPASVEGFLYPATYPCDPGTTPQDALTAMVLRFVQQDRNTDFASDAKTVGLTPYQALIVASVAQSEARYSADMPKVARVILNRIAARQPMQFDSTSSYACKLAGTPASKCIYHQVVGPYNTYTHTGLPPTPIDNPGASAMDAAVHPVAGKWMYFVNIDKAGHLGFFTTEKAFDKARVTCQKNNWGCGA